MGPKGVAGSGRGVQRRSQGWAGPAAQKAAGVPNGKVVAASMCEERSCAAGGANVCAGDYGQGCGIVEFETADSAAEAINTLHLSEVRRSRCCWSWRSGRENQRVAFDRLCFRLCLYVSRPPTWPRSPSIRSTCPCSTGFVLALGGWAWQAEQALRLQPPILQLQLDWHEVYVRDAHCCEVPGGS